MQQQPDTEKKTGVHNLLAATGHSFAGFKTMIKEPAFRKELVFFTVILLALWIGAAPLSSFAIATLLFLILAAVESLNTAVEEIVDEVSPHHSSFGKVTKDLGSFAVFTLLLANGLHALYALFGSA